MNCPRQTSNNMATLLQQQNCIKTLTTNNGNGSTNVVGVGSSSSASGQITAARVLLPHEISTATASTESAMAESWRRHDTTMAASSASFPYHQHQQQQQYTFYNSGKNFLPEDQSVFNSNTSTMYRPLTALHPHQQHHQNHPHQQLQHPHQTYTTSVDGPTTALPKPLQGVTEYSSVTSTINQSFHQHQNSPATIGSTATTTMGEKYAHNNGENSSRSGSVGRGCSGNGNNNSNGLINGTDNNGCGAIDESTIGNSTTTSNAGDVQDGEDAEPEPEIDIVINNVVCSFSVRCHLNLREIALNGRNVEFRRENGMVTMKLRRPYTTASIWSSGRITCTGATSEDQAKIGARRYARCLQSLGFPVKFNNFRVVNVLGTCSMPWAIKIVNFSERFKKEASYEPELHPGVTYKLKTPKATLKIFSTGSITVTASSVANVQAAIEHIFPLVYEFRKKRVVPVPEEIVIDNSLMKEVTNDMDQFEASNKPKRKKYPLGMENDPDDDIMCVSDVDEEDDDRD